MKILRSEQAEYRQLASQASGEAFSRTSMLSQSLGLGSLHVSQEKLAPGLRASAPHSHAQMDEMVYVLKGILLAQEGENKRTLQPGDCAAFEAGASALHFLKNESDEEAEFLLIRRTTKAEARYEV